MVELGRPGVVEIPPDPFAPEFRADPHPIYHQIRAASRAYRFHSVIGVDEWILTGFEDCEAVLRDPRWSVDPGRRASNADGGFLNGMTLGDFPVMLFLDPPDHTRLRRLVSKGFTVRSVDALRPRIRALVDELVAAHEPSGGMEVIADLAYPLPVTVICEMLGVPVEDQAGFSGWSSDASRLLDGGLDEDAVTRGVAALLQFVQYFEALFARRRAEPADDLISRLLAVEEEGDALLHQELMATVILLFLAGHETTMNLIGNGLHALLSHPEQWALLCADPSGRAAAAVEETLRWDGPVHLSGRVAAAPVTVAGRDFAEGDEVVTLLAAANRDPAVHADPDRFDITRPDPRHLTFSHGLHFCLGAALARVEGQETLAALARRHPGLQLVTGSPTYRDHFILRGFESLHVSF